MRRNYALQLFLAIFLCTAFIRLQAQNLFANAGFEDINTCSEYNATCAPEAWFNIPATNFLINAKTAPRPMIGHMVLTVPIGNVMENFNQPRFVYTAFCCPLIAGEKYQLSFYLNTARAPFEGLSFFLTKREPQSANIDALEAPDFIIANEHIDAEMKEGWKHVQFEYTAKGYERFFIITTKGLPIHSWDMKQAMNHSGDILCFIDEIKWVSEKNLPPCTAYDANVKKLYDYNYRHTNSMPVFNEPEEVAPKPQFTNDTLVLPDLLFDVGKANIKPAAISVLDSLAAELQKRKWLVMNITGHTDNTGKENANKLLSEARAKTIQQYLLQKVPGLTEKCSASGKGQNYPVADNATAAGRQKNRRVEIVVTYFEIKKPDTER